MKQRSQPPWKSKRIWILASLIIIFRALLPPIVTSYVNKTLSTIPGYQGHIDDVDITLIRGPYVIQAMRLDNPTRTSLPTLSGLLKNAFIRALSPGIQGTITIQKARAQ